MEYNKLIDYLLYIVYGLTIIILVMDLAYVFEVEIAFTISRVTVYCKDIFTFTGSLLYDHVFLLFLTIILIFFTFLKTRERKNLILLPLLFFTAYSIVIDYQIITPFLVLLVIVLTYFFCFKKIREFVYSILYGLTVFEIQKIIYLLLKIWGYTITKINSSIYVNIVLWYLSWSLNYIFILVAFIRIFLIILNKVKNAKIKEFSSEFFGKIRAFPTRKNTTDIVNSKGNNSNNSLFLMLSLITCFIIVLIPYFPSINPKQHPVNTDWIYYYEWLNQLINGNFNVFYLHSDRPLFLAILYLVWYIFRLDPKVIAIYHNIPLLLLYSFSIYLLASKWFNKETANYALLLTPFSPIFLTFIYGGFQANLLALSLIYLSISYIMDSTRKKFFLGMLLYALTMFIHEWTWLQYFIVFNLYIVTKILKHKFYNTKIEHRLKYFSIFLFIEFVLFSTKYVLIDKTIINENILRSVIPNKSFIDSINWFFVVYTGGTLNNPLYYFLNILGIGNSILSLPGLSIIVSYTLAILPWNILIYRIFLNTPINIIAGEGLRKLKPSHRLLFIISIIGIGLWKLLSIIPNFSL